jgi:hypothetical protein
MELLTPEQGQTPVTGFNVYDTVLIMHLVEKLLRCGAVTGRELSFVSELRGKAVNAAQTACGYDIEQLNQKVTESQGG